MIDPALIPTNRRGAAGPQATPVDERSMRALELIMAAVAIAAALVLALAR